MPGILRRGELIGPMLETFVVAQLRVEATIAACRPNLYHIRTRGGRHEVDLVLEIGPDRVIGIEVKATAAPGRSEARHLIWLKELLGDRFAAGIVFHTGPRSYFLDTDIVAAPIASLWHHAN